jgi:hypothetical protein
MSNPNYVCVKSGNDVKRILRVDADKLVSSGVWSYCPRSVWKEKVRGSEIVTKTPRKAKSSVKNTKSKGRTRKTVEKKTIETKSEEVK